MADLKRRIGGDYSLICCDEFGQPAWHSRLRRHYYPILERAGLQRVRYHDLRHSFSSFLLSQKEPVHLVSRQLGHSSPAVTLGIYAHMLPGDDERAGQVMEGLLKAARLRLEGRSVENGQIPD
jgi:integrase